MLRHRVLAAVAHEARGAQLIHGVVARARSRADGAQQPARTPHLVLDPGHGAVARGTGLQVRPQKMAVEAAECESGGVVQGVAVGDALPRGGVQVGVVDVGAVVHSVDHDATMIADQENKQR